MDNIDNEVTEIRRVPEIQDNPPASEVVGVGPGTVLANYRLHSIIGAGLSSEVFDAENLVARKRCVVKVFRPELNIGLVAFGRYVHEAKRVAELANPGIADVFYSGKSDGRSFTVMPREQGSDLRSVVRSKAPLSRRVYLPIIRAICEVLAEIHAVGLCHGHLHGGQVMLQMAEQSITVKLLDFGTHHLLPGVKDATPGWERRPEDAICMAPELAKGLAPDLRSDIYALSVLLYEMVTGKVPFVAQTFEETLEQHANEDPVRPSSLAQIPAGLEETLLRGLDKDPRKRIPSVEALLAGLDPRSATGAQKTVGAGGARAMGLTPSQSREYDLSSMQGGGAPGPGSVAAGLSVVNPGMQAPVAAADELEAVVKPRSKSWLLVLLLVLVLLAMAAAGAYLFLMKKPAGKKPVKKPTTPARVVPRAPAPRTRPVKPKPVPRPARKVRTPQPKAQAAPPPPAPETAPEPPKKAPPPMVARVAAIPAEGTRKNFLQARGVQLYKGSGSLSVATGNPAAKVYVNGHLKGEGEKVSLKDLPVGTHRIQLEINGKKLPHRDIKIARGQLLDIAF